MRNKYKLNHNFLENHEEWGEEQAYFLGWILSDGHVNLKSNQISIKLKYSDIGVLEKLKDIIGFDGPIRVERRNGTNLIGCCYQDRAVLTFSSKDIKLFFASKGLSGDKSNMTFPDWIPNNLISHFLRAYFEGDGCISHSLDKKYDRLLGEINILFPINFCDVAVDIIKQNTDVAPKAQQSNYGNEMQLVRYSGNENVCKIFTFLYKDARLLLRRKLQKFEEIIKFSSSRKMLGKSQGVLRAIEVLSQLD